MLSLTLHEKDYLTINGDIVVQLYQISSNQCRISIDADRSVSIVRGKVLEREGAQRPACLAEKSVSSGSQPAEI